ncbi:hypothetical protein DJ564_23765 [Pseudomonas sp. 31-12]|uniref:hypothetical protein n=1 Tax=Pseudomonas sp. 31-12 TaxID=2201356 RepID=UPI000D6D404C|nr:hypothetical protein [Pseudomonas sp. 31-12]AWM93586.1 hypothetical protein DJ564_23765 [Pseudomonas sp. 31-12]
MKIALKALLFCSALWSTAAFSASKELKVGDIWAYKTRPGEDGSTLTILKIENYPKLGKVVHIRVDGFRMINPVTGSEFNEMPHLPFQAKALERSITHRMGETADIPEFSQGYATWKAALDEGKAGAFKITVRQVLGGLINSYWEASD